METKNICVTFAGPVGSSKSPISNYLSTTFNLPVFNNDNIRTEITEDIGIFVEKEFLERLELRLRKVVESQISFILDASVDRVWETKGENIKKSGYKFFIISLDLSKDFLVKLYRVKKYDDSLNRFDEVFNDHQNFLKRYGGIVNISINDENFKDRLEICRQELEKWLIELKLRK